MARAFIIGNGPSLKAEQLEKLIPEVTFGVNRIHLIYDQTKWRPIYWVIMDFSNSIFYKQDIDLHSNQGYECYLRKDIAAKYFEWCLSVFPDKERTFPNTENLHILDSCGHVDCDRFTSDGWHVDDPASVCKMGGSVPASIQMAVHMGYNPIYTIGMDGNRKGNAENNFIAGYIPVDNMNPEKARIANETMDLALRIAKRECSKLGIKLIDATVGGSAYQALPEVDFFELFD